MSQIPRDGKCSPCTCLAHITTALLLAFGVCHFRSETSLALGLVRFGLRLRRDLLVLVSLFGFWGLVAHVENSVRRVELTGCAVAEHARARRRVTKERDP